MYYFLFFALSWPSYLTFKFDVSFEIVEGLLKAGSLYSEQERRRREKEHSFKYVFHMINKEQIHTGIYWYNFNRNSIKRVRQQTFICTLHLRNWNVSKLSVVPLELD